MYCTCNDHAGTLNITKKNPVLCKQRRSAEANLEKIDLQEQVFRRVKMLPYENPDIMGLNIKYCQILSDFLFYIMELWIVIKRRFTFIHTKNMAFNLILGR